MQYRILTVVAILFVGNVVAEPSKEQLSDSNKPLTIHVDSPLLTAQAKSNWVETELIKQLGLAEGNGLSVKNAQSQINGQTVLSVVQTYQGLPVAGADSKLLFDHQSKPLKLFGHSPNLRGDLPSKALLTQQTAMNKSGLVTQQPYSIQLAYWSNTLTGHVLSYEIEGVFSTKTGESGQKVYVDAASGDILQRLPMEHSAKNRQVNDFGAACKELNVFLPLVSPFTELVEARAKQKFSRRESDSPVSNDRVNQGFKLLGDGYDFLYSVAGLDSIDNKGLLLNLFVDVKYSSNQSFSGVQCAGKQFNASWVSSKQSLYLPNEALAFTEIIMHELTHGIVSNGSNLEYVFQSGALNESIADSVGVSFRAWLEYGNRSTDLKNLKDDIWLLRGPDQVMRNMANPNSIAFRKSTLPSHMNEFKTLAIEDNNGGVHINSSIMNMGFYLLANGGLHPKYPNKQPVKGIGMFDATKIVAQAAAKLLFSRASFEDARYAFAETAELLHGVNSQQWVSVHQAMDAIGISGEWQIPAEVSSNQQPEIPPETQPSPEVKTEQPNNLPEQPPKEPIEATEVVDEPSSEKTEPVAQEPKSDVSTLTDDEERTLLIIGLAVLGVLLGVVAVVKLKPQYEDKTKRTAFQNDAKSSPHRQQKNSESEHKEVKSEEQYTNPITAHKPFSLQSINGQQSLPLSVDLLESDEGLIIGRASEIVHIQLTHKKISRRHLRLRLVDNKLTVEELNSSYGSSINGQPLKPFTSVIVMPNQVLKLADFAYILKQ